MGWAIKLPDGTYRCWNANAQDDTLRPGEVWESLLSPPEIPLPVDLRPTKAQITAAIAGAVTVADLKAAVLQLLQRI